MHNKTWIHVGFPKCASTALQKDFFSRCPDINYVGRWKNWDEKTSAFYAGSTLRIASLPERYYEKQESSIVAELIGEFDGPDSHVRVISDEGLTGGIRPFVRSVPLVDSSQVALRLARAFPEANILMVIRNQLRLIPSFFGQVVTHNENIDVDPNSFLEAHTVLEGAGLGNFFQVCDYASIYECYVNQFGQDKVHILLQEELISDALGFMTRLVELLGLAETVDPKDFLPGRHNTRKEQIVRSRKSQAKSARHVVGRFVPAPLRKMASPLFPSPPTSPVSEMEFSDEQIEFLNSFYGSGNQRLQAILGDSRISDAGYPMGE